MRIATEKCALVGLPYGGDKGGVSVDPNALSARELENLSRRYMQEMIPFIGTHIDVMAPDMGTNEQVMAWMMDTYSIQTGHPVPAIVTGKPVSVGGSEGRREATERGVAYIAKCYLERLEIPVSSATVAIQGFGNVGSEASLAFRLDRALFAVEVQKENYQFSRRLAALILGIGRVVRWRATDAGRTKWWQCGGFSP